MAGYPEVSVPALRFDHFLTYTDAVTLEDHTAGYRAAGFGVLDRTVRHDHGRRNGFVGFGPEYIEFCWVEDEALFATASSEERAWRHARRPYGIGMVTDNVQALHDAWSARGYALPAVWSKAPRDAPAETPPLWSLQEIPATLLPGVRCFALTYHRRRAVAVAVGAVRPEYDLRHHRGDVCVHRAGRTGAAVARGARARGACAAGR